MNFRSEEMLDQLDNHREQWWIGGMRWRSDQDRRYAALGLKCAA